MTSRYKHPAKDFLLRFEDLPGLEVHMRSVSVGKLMDMAGLADEFKGGDADPAKVSELFTMFADRLVSWNLDGDDDKPVPADLAGVRSLDVDLFMAIFEGWFESIVSAPPPLQKPSANGSHPMEGSLPMEPLPASRAS